MNIHDKQQPAALSSNATKRIMKGKPFMSLFMFAFMIVMLVNTSDILYRLNNSVGIVSQGQEVQQRKDNHVVKKEEGGLKVFIDSKKLPLDPFTCSASPPSKRLVSLLIGVYDGSDVIQHTLEAIRAQTYRPMEIIVSIDESADSDKSYTILKEFKEEYNKEDFQITVYQQKDRLHWIDNVNFLMSKSSGDYVAFLPHDDFIPPKYIQKLTKCLDDEPGVTNCYPVLKFVEENGDVEKEFHQKDIVGPQINRVDEAIVHRAAVSFRGLVRRPKHGSMQPFYVPHLYKNFYIADNVQILFHAIEGNLKEVDVIYEKKIRSDSVMSKAKAEMKENAVAKEYGAKLLHVMTAMYDRAHSYASSSETTYSTLKKRIVDDMTYEYNLPYQSVLSSFDKHMVENKRVAVLGAGIQGCVMALMFQKHGYDVTIYDKSDDIMNRASMGGEGKIHLGLVYNMDLTMKTAKHMMNSALRFSPYIDYLVGKPVDWESLKSERFHYLLPYTSLITPAQFEDYVSDLEDIYETMLMEDPELSYLGLRPPKLIERLDRLNPMINETFFQAQYKTAEYSVSPKFLKATMKQALLEKSIKMVFGRRVDSVSRNEPGNDKLGKMRVVTDVSNHDFDMVVNCLWEGRDKIDRSIGVRLESGLNYRYKVGVKFPFVDEFAAMPSFTIINGAFGDFVRYDRDTGMYFSYYPVARIGITTNETKAMEWDELAEGNNPKEFYDYQVKEHTKAFNHFFPKLQDSFTCPRVGGGYILGNGETDITDKNTKLHERADFPFLIDDGYVTVSTQKLTAAPSNAQLLEKYLFDKEFVDEE